MSDMHDDRGSGLTALSEGLAIALDVMATNKVRSALTVLGVAVGVSVVVSMGALVTGLRSSIMDAVNSSGPNNLVIVRFDFSQIQAVINGDRRAAWRGRPQIEPEEVRRIRALPTIRNATYDLNQFEITMEVDGVEMGGIIASGYEPGWTDYSPGDFVSGRDFSVAEMDQGRPVVVITTDLATELFGELDPMGREIKVENPRRASQEHFTVVGVFQPIENIFSSAFKYYAVFPWTSANRRLGRNKFEAQILIVPEDSVSAQEAEDAMFTFLKRKDEGKFLIDSVNAAQRSVDLALIQYRDGTADYTRVLNSQNSLLSQQEANRHRAREKRLEGSLAPLAALGHC